MFPSSTNEILPFSSLKKVIILLCLNPPNTVKCHVFLKSFVEFNY